LPHRVDLDDTGEQALARFGQKLFGRDGARGFGLMLLVRAGGLAF
jgi:hypothetical protein